MKYLKKFLKYIFKKFKICHKNLYFIFSPYLKINNVRFRRPVFLGVVFNNHIRVNETWLTDLLSNLSIPKNGVFLDIGVNVGQTLLSVKSFSPLIKYYGFEPNPACIYYVQELIKINSLKNSTIVPIGLSDKTDIQSFWISKNFPIGSGSTLNKEIKSIKEKREFFVPVFHFDSIVKSIDIKSSSIMKIDVEGHEPEVLYGAKEFILRERPFLIIEVLPLRDKQDIGRSEVMKKLEKLVNNWGFFIFKIVLSEKGNFIGLEKQIKFSRKSISKDNENYSRDYILVHKDRISIIEKLKL